MTVFENVSFPLKVAKDRSYSRDEIRKLTGKALETVDLSGFSERSATKLSGGQQQRVALARAIVREPKLLLLDEPLSNLDAALRDSMRKELKRLQQQIGVTTVYVTHDQSEALEMSDQIAVLEAGKVVQVDTPTGIYFRPRDRFVAGFVGTTNIFNGSARDAAEEGETAVVALETGEILHCTARGFVGNLNRYDIRIGDRLIVANTGPRTEFASGETVTFDFDADDAIVLANEAAA